MAVKLNTLNLYTLGKNDVKFKKIHLLKVKFMFFFFKIVFVLINLFN